MKTIFYFVLFTIFASAEFSFGIPPAIAKEILKHQDSIFDFGDGIDFGMFSDPIIRGTDQIRFQSIEVGNPAVTLNVLVVSPLDYGFKVSGTVDRTNKEKMSFQFGIKAHGLSPDDEYLKRSLSTERIVQYNDSNGEDFKPTNAE